MSLKLNSSGGGSVTLQEPVTASDLTVNLPATLGNTGNSMVVTSDASGNVGVGTSSPSEKLDVNGNIATNAVYKTNRSNAGAVTSGSSLELLIDGTTYAAIRQPSAETLAFYRGAGGTTETARIDSSGNLLVGTTSAGGRITSAASGFGTAGYFSSSGSSATVAVVDSGVTGAGIGLFGNGTNPNKYVRAANGNWEVINSTYSAVIISITNAGAAFQGNNSSSWSTVSDARIKDNIRPLNNALDKMLSLKPCHFEYKSRLGQAKTGFIAQEFETVLPGHVCEQEPSMEFSQFVGNGEKIKGIDADLTPYLVKAIQELKAELDTVKAELAVLKGTA
jgi:hypothetical protein